MSKHKHDWLALEARWIAGEWKTFKEMSGETGVTVRMLQKRSFARRWKEKRQDVEDEATERARKRAVNGLADRLIEANERALKNANILLNLGLSRFVDRRGRLKKVTIGSDATAIHAIKSAIQIEQAILRRQPFDTPDAPIPESDDGTIVPTTDSGIEELTDAELERIAAAASKAIDAINQPEKLDRDRKSGGRGIKKKARSKK